MPRHDKVKINRANGQIGGKNRGITFVLTVLISFGLFNIFQINLLLDDSGDYDSSSLREQEALWMIVANKFRVEKSML
jgi:hypothetical protein